MLETEWWQDPKVLFDGAGVAVTLFIIGIIINNRRGPRGPRGGKRQLQRSGSRSTNIQAGGDIGSVDLGGDERG